MAYAWIRGFPPKGVECRSGILARTVLTTVCVSGLAGSVPIQAAPEAVPPPACVAENPHVDRFLWLRDLNGRIAPSGHKESVEILSRTPSELVVSTDQWHSRDEVGGRLDGANALVGPPGETYPVLLNRFRIESGSGAVERWRWGPHRAFDARLQIVTLLSPADTRPESTTPLPPGNRIVVDLPFRHTTGNDSDWTLTGEEWAGIFQVPAGETLVDARRNPTNQLCRLACLDEWTPATRASFGFALDKSGYWEFQVDLDTNGTLDVVVTAKDEGNRYSTGMPIPGKPAQAIRVTAADGTRPGQVCRTQAEVAIRLPPPGTEGVRLAGRRINRRPIEVHAAAHHRASPALLCGQVWGEAWRAHVREPGTEQVFPAYTIDKRDFVAPVELLPGRTREVLVSQRPAAENPDPEAPTAPVRLAWDPLPLSPGSRDPQVTRIATGQAVCLAASNAVRFLVTRDLALVREIPATATPAPCLLQEPGSHTITAHDTQGAVIGSAIVDVFPVGLPDSLVQQSQGRSHLVSLGACRADALAFELRDVVGLPVKKSVRTVKGDGPFLYAIPKAPRGAYHLVVSDRKTKQELASAPLNIFDLELVQNRAPAGITQEEDGLYTQWFQVRMAPYLPNVTIRFQTLDTTCTFLNRAPSFTVNTRGTPASHGEPGFRPSTTNDCATFDYRIRYPETGSACPHRFDPVWE